MDTNNYQSGYQARRRAIRQKAKDGDPKAQEIVQGWYKMSREAKRRARQEGRSYDKPHDQERRRKYCADKALATAGDNEAALRVAEWRRKRGR